ncbi:MAG: c-type cytochrome, partial [Terriglobales bacterium]
MRNRKSTLGLFLLISFFSAAQENKAPTTAYDSIPVQAVRKLNPVKPTPESIAEGKKIYGYDCASCHGASGNGKTDVAKDMRIPDLTDREFLRSRTDGELFYV